MKASTTKFLRVIAILFVPVLGVSASESDIIVPEDIRFEDEWEDRAAAVNEGELRILQQAPDLSEHHHQSHLTITQASINTGWVRMRQCHTNLDATSALQIVFIPGRVRDLEIVSHSKIARAWVENDTVQLEDISTGSSICLSLKTRALSVDGEKILLKNGPFMRQFLDGFYPMRMSMQVEYPVEILRYVEIKPQAIPCRADYNKGRLEVDVRFEGRLYTEIGFERIKRENQ